MSRSMSAGPLPTNRWTRLALAVAVWTLIAALFASKSSIRGEPVAWLDGFYHELARWYVWGLLSAPILWVDARLPIARERIVGRLLAHVPLSFGFTLIYVYLSLWLSAGLRAEQWAPPSPTAFVDNALAGSLHWNLLIYWMIFGVASAYDYARRYQERQVRAAELERLLTESRLHNLQAQLHPHFLFNALNAVSAHVESDPRRARRMLEQLGDLLRMSLDRSERQEIPLDDELAFLERYLAIQRERFEDRLDVRLDVSPEAREALAPTFVLQPLVENAIRHGIAPQSRLGVVKVSAWRENGSLRLNVEDNGSGLPAGWDLETGQGVGLANTRERLRRLYGPEAQRFSIVGSPGAGARVEVSLPFRRADGLSNLHVAHTNGHR